MSTIKANKEANKKYTTDAENEQLMAEVERLNDPNTLIDLGGDYGTLFRIMKVRRSVRLFDPNSTVAWKDIVHILNAACWAPSAGNHQQWIYVVVDDPKWKSELASLTTKKLNMAPVAIFCFFSYKDTRHPLDNIMSVSASIQNMLLAATSLNVGNLWVAGFAKSKVLRDIVRRKLQVPFEYRLLSIVLLGDPKFKPPVPGRKPFGEAVFRNKMAADTSLVKSLDPRKWPFDQYQKYMSKLMPIFTSREYENPQREVAMEVMKYIPEEGKVLDLNSFFCCIQQFYQKKNKNIMFTNPVEQSNIFLRNIMKTENVITCMPDKTPFKDGEFDTVVLTETLNYFPHPRVFKEAKRVLKKKGEMLVLVKKKWSFDHFIYILFGIIHRNEIFKQLFDFKKGPCWYMTKKQAKKLLVGMEIKSVETVHGKLKLPFSDKVLKPFNIFKKITKDYYLIRCVKK